MKIDEENLKTACGHRFKHYITYGSNPQTQARLFKLVVKNTYEVYVGDELARGFESLNRKVIKAFEKDGFVVKCVPVDTYKGIDRFEAYDNEMIDVKVEKIQNKDQFETLRVTVEDDKPDEAKRKREKIQTTLEKYGMKSKVCEFQNLG